jgi:hypothetical protein
VNQWDQSFGRRIICEKSTDEGDPAATEKRMGTRSTRHRRLSQRLPANQRTPEGEKRLVDIGPLVNTEFLREPLPGNAAVEHEDNAGQARAIRNARPPTLLEQGVYP